MKVLLFSCIFSILFLQGFAQQQKQANPKVYNAEDGKLFVQKSLPVYLWISTSPDSLSEKVQLKSATTPEYANPMYFDADGYNSVRVKGQVDHKTKKVVNTDKEVVFEVYGDSKPPESYVIVQSRHTKYKDGKRVYKNECVLDILSYDMFSGVGKIYFSINNNPFERYDEQLIIKEEGDVKLRYYAVDNVGNEEEIKALSFSIEK